MIKVKRIDHVAIAVRDRGSSVQLLENIFELCPGPSEHVASQGTDVAFLQASQASQASQVSQFSQFPHPGDEPVAVGHADEAGHTALEIIAPASPPGNPGLDRFLDRRGPGLHHICFEVDDLAAALATLKAAGVRLIDEVPRAGARGHLVAFIHPASTGGVLFELCATPHGAQA